HPLQPRVGDLDAEDPRRPAAEPVVVHLAFRMKDRRGRGAMERGSAASLLVRPAERKGEVGELVLVTRQRRAGRVRVLGQGEAGRLVRAQYAAEKLARLKSHVGSRTARRGGGFSRRRGAGMSAME